MKSSLVLMVEPVAFATNVETLETNKFQKTTAIDAEKLQEDALSEFRGVVRMLAENNIRVHVVKDIAKDKTPDSIFPNNWVSFHADGRAILYPMQAENRRRERRLSYLYDLMDAHDITLDHIVDFSFEEHYGRYLEGTGSVVFDHDNKIAYACRSERMHETILEKLCRVLGYQPIIFSSVDQNNDSIYHANVMMAVAKEFVVVCLDSVSNESEQNHLKASIEQTGKKIVDISYDQMNHFCGNVLALSDDQGLCVLAMSTTAFDHFTDAQKTIMSKHAKLVHAPIPTIETCGGGSVRCMICEVA